MELEYITELLENGGENIPEMIELIDSKLGYSIKSISKDSDTPNSGVLFELPDGHLFNLQEISSQCAWLVLGDYINPTSQSCEIAIEILEFVAEELAYAGVFINITTDFIENIAIAYEYIPITPTLYYKGLKYEN